MRISPFGAEMTISNVASISIMGLSRARRHRDFLFEADRMTGKISAGGDRLRVPRGREIPATPAFVVAGFPAPLYERENRGAATPTVATASCSCVERKTPPRRGSSWRG